MLADGGRCVSDLVALGSQPALFGDVASVSTARRVLLSVGEAELDRLRAARAQARARAWAAGAAPAQVILDFDATPITAHSDKELAAGHYKGGFGFQSAAGDVRPRGAGRDPAARQRRRQQRRRSSGGVRARARAAPAAALDGPILARSDSAGASHAFADACRETDVRFSFGYAIDARVREAILASPEVAWRPAINGDGKPREGAWVAELTGHVALDAWPEGLPADRPPRAPAPRRAAVVHRRRRAPLSVLHHRPARRRSGRPGGPPPRPRDRRRPRPRRQEHRPGQPAVLRVRAQPGVAGSRALRARPDRLDPSYCSSTASTASASPSGCATGCCTSPVASPATPAGSRCTCPPTGPGPPPSPRRSSASPRCPPDRPTPSTTPPSTPARAGTSRRAAPHREPAIAGARHPGQRSPRPANHAHSPKTRRHRPADPLEGLAGESRLVGRP